ncbi:MAG TPA: glycosyltransferase family 39 protein [Acidobacteriaceae bacterium]|nr:glycosyltransferase family 39 protein [Acidobacteriaceae bacterium]
MTLRRNLPDLLPLTAAVALTRFLFRSRILYDLDSVNFALAMKRFDPSVFQAHPPGYYLYSRIGWLIDLVFHNPNLSLVILSILASCGLVILIYQFALDWFGRSPARFAALLFLFSPLCWFHGAVALTYIVGAFCSGLVGYLCWRLNNGHSGYLVPAALALGFAAGIRPSELLFLAPLYLYSLRRLDLKQILLGLLAVLLAVLAWFVPMILASGGLNAYFGALFALWHMVPGKKTAFNSSPAYTIARAFTILFIYTLTFGAASFAPLAEKLRTTPIDREKVRFTLVWITPALCFFTFIFLVFINSGYLLLLAVPACLWLGLWASGWYTNARLGKSLKLAVIVACAAANTAIFLFAPLYCSYRSVRQLQSELKNIQTTLPSFGAPSNTLIVSFDSHFLGFRHAGYYLPQYHVLEYPEVNMGHGMVAFTMYDRDTHLVTRIPGPYTRFVLYPLPAQGKQFKQYLAKILAKIPPGDLKITGRNGHTYVTGPIKDLRSLFPVLAAASK